MSSKRQSARAPARPAHLTLAGLFAGLFATGCAAEELGGQPDAARLADANDPCFGRPCPDAWVSPDASGPVPFPRYVTVHGSELNYDLDMARAAFSAAADIGFTGIRTDIRWFLIEPERDVADEEMFAFFSALIDVANERGLDFMVIFSSAPGWATDLLASDEDAFWLEYEEYVGDVLERVGPRVSRYQLWNELNHIVDPIPAELDWQMLSRAGGLVASMDPGSRRYVNAMANVSGWEAAIDDWVNKAGSSFDVIAIDHYPGTWCCIQWDDWNNLEVVLNRLTNPADAWYGKAGAVMETGFSSWAAFIADEEDQETWVRQSIPRVRGLFEQANMATPGIMELFGYYQLIDTNTASLPEELEDILQEAHFGILHDDLSPKIARDALQEELSFF